MQSPAHTTYHTTRYKTSHLATHDEVVTILLDSEARYRVLFGLYDGVACIGLYDGVV